MDAEKLFAKATTIPNDLLLTRADDRDGERAIDIDGAVIASEGPCPDGGASSRTVAARQRMWRHLELEHESWIVGDGSRVDGARHGAGQVQLP